MKKNFELMAKYNQWMNQNLYNSALQLSNEKLNENQGAFFGSIIGTFNHIIVADIIWLKRFANHQSKYKSLDFINTIETPTSLNKMINENLQELKVLREKLDELIVSFILEIKEEDFELNLSYKDTKGKGFTKDFSFLLQHFFNHQTHHRGQITTLLNQNGVDFGVTDLNFIIPSID
ncbi:MAG: DinB family protein [Candidatus Sericytochromatia bacterium]